MPFEDLIKTIEVIGLLEEIIQRTINIRRNYKIKLPDAVVAATAIEFELTVITRNTADFVKVKGLSVVNPHDMK